MSGNSFGRLFTVTTWGESHGPNIGAIVDGCPPGLALSEADLQGDLDRRKPGQSKHVTQRKESDEVRIVSGVFEGRTTGTPIGLMIENQDQRSKDYSKIADRFRPNHADYAYQQKYGVRDYRGGGRSSARQTAMRVAAGAIAKKWLSERFGVSIRACITQIGEVTLEGNVRDWSAVEENDFFWPNSAQLGVLDDYLVGIRRLKDSVGARVEVEASGIPPGWGEPIFDALDADIAHAMMGINAAKAVEVGDGFSVVSQKGSEHRDELSPAGFLSNHSGGVQGGISSGQHIRAAVAFKPTSSIQVPGRSVNLTGESVDVVTTGRHDPCVGIRAVPIVEAMLALVLMDHALRHRAQCADVQQSVPVLRSEPD